MPIKAQQQLERIFQYLSEQSECTCKDVCALLEVKERRARQLLQELQEQGRIEAIGANKTRRYRLIKKRAESQDSLIIGFVACREDYRRQGITKKLMYFFEEKRDSNISHWVLWKMLSFFEKCGYKVIFQVQGQNIYQKIL